jgi:hypothetical protein
MPIKSEGDALMRASPSANSPIRLAANLASASSQALVVSLAATRLRRIDDAARALAVLPQATLAATIASRLSPHVVIVVVLVLHVESGCRTGIRNGLRRRSKHEELSCQS